MAIKPSSVSPLDDIDKEKAKNEKFDKLSELGYESLTSKQQKLYDELSSFGMIPWWNFIGDGCSFYCCCEFGITASSTLANQGNYNYDADNIINDLRNAWTEGISGYGIGEKVTFNFYPNT